MAVVGIGVKRYITISGDFLGAAMSTVKTSPPPKPVPRKDVPINAEYETKAKVTLRDAMTARGLNYDALAERLNAMGVEITARGLENKISRGGFSAAFYLQCMDALGSDPK